VPKTPFIISLIALASAASYPLQTQPAAQPSAELWYAPIGLLVETGAVHAIAIFVSAAAMLLALSMRNSVGKVMRPTYTWTSVGLFFLALTHLFHYLLMLGLQEDAVTIVFIEHFFYVVGVSSILYGLWETLKRCAVG